MDPTPAQPATPGGHDRGAIGDDATDEALMARVVAGDRAAFTALVLRHRGRVFRIARSLTADDAAAEDVLQETFVAALRGAAGFRGEAFRAWLYTIARHQAARSRRRAVPVPTDDDTLEALGAAAGWGDPAAGTAAALDDRERVARALDALSPDDRELLVLRDVEGLSGDETARVLGVGVRAMKSRLHRARLRLAAALRAPEGADHAGS